MNILNVTNLIDHRHTQNNIYESYESIECNESRESTECSESK